MKRWSAVFGLLVIAMASGFGWGFFAHRNQLFPYLVLKRVFGASEAKVAASLSEQSALQVLGYVDATYDPEHATSGVLIHDPRRSFTGHNFYNSRTASEALLVDMAGTVLHRWQVPGEAWQSAELLRNGDVLAIVKNNALLRLNRDSKLLWSFAAQVHHDLSVYDGVIYVLDRRSRVIAEIHPEIPVVEDLVTVLDGQGGVVEHISVLEIVRSSPYAFLLPTIARDLSKSEVAGIDILHTNHVEVFDGSVAAASPLFAAGNMLLSCRTINAVFIVDGTSREILWLWGPSNLTMQHHPRLIGNGHILVFDNGIEASRVLEIDPLRNVVVWSYQADGLFSARRGSVQRLGNGNTLITESDAGYVHEVTAEGEVVWRFANPDVSAGGKRSAIWRMTRLPEDFLTNSESEANASP